MPDYLFFPPVREVRGTITAPASKSATNRALVLAALSPRSVELVRPLDSEDTHALARCLTAMGASIAASTTGLRVHGPLGIGQGEVTLDAGESGTAARFLLALAAVTPGHFVLTGSSRLRERPVGALVAALRDLGARIQFQGNPGSLPVAVEGQKLTGARVTVDASESSQFVSALLLAGAALPEGLTVRPAGPVASLPYIAMTIESLREFGHAVVTEPELQVRPGAGEKERYDVPGDFSSALPLLAAAGMAGGEVCVEGLRWPSADADAHAIPVLEQMGLEVSKGRDRISARRGQLRAATVRATDFPDAVPTLVALAALAPGSSRFEGIGHLRLKESDRLEALAGLLQSAGIAARAESDAIVVEGPPADGPEIVRRLPTWNDHRIAMAAALLSLRLPGLAIENPRCVGKSYPAFFRDLDRLAVR